MLQKMLFAYFWTLFPFFRKLRIFLKNGVWGSLYPLMPSNFMQNMKKIQWANFEQYTKKVDIFQLLCPLLLLFALFWGNRAFFQKSDNNILNVLWYSIFMEKIIKNGWTVQKIVIWKIKRSDWSRAFAHKAGECKYSQIWDLRTES